MVDLIFDLENDIINGVDDLQILRKALILSKQMNLDELTILINNELNGYDESEELPDYRIFECTLMCDTKYKKYVQTDVDGFPDEQYDLLHTMYLYESIPEIIDLINSNYPFIIKTLDYRIQKPILESNNDLVSIYRICPMHKLKSIISNVKNIILEWCVELDKQELPPTNKENSKIRNDTSITINNYNITGDNPQITNIILFNGIKDHLNDMQNILNSQDIDEDIKINIQNNVVLIKEELERKNPNLSKIKTTSNIIKSFIKEITISATANLLTQHIDEIINIISSLL